MPPNPTWRSAIPDESGHPSEGQTTVKSVQRLRSRRPSSASRLRASFERLEDRTLLSGNIYTVTSLGDVGGGFVTFGGIRAAIIDADQNPGSTINFSVTGTIQLADALPDLSANVTITGPGAGSLTVQGGGSSSDFSVFTVDAGVTASISGLTISGGNTQGLGGGGISNKGALTLAGSIVSNNATTGSGGGISNAGTMTMAGCTVADNVADSYGGGIENVLGTMTIVGCTISGNSEYRSSGEGAAGGGGIDNEGNLTVTSSIISGNSAHGTQETGGGINNLSKLTVTDSTISGNDADGDGGGISNSGTATLTNCTIAGNGTSGTGAYDFNGGGGIFNSNFTSLTNCTVAYNDLNGGEGGGINTYNSNTQFVLNNTLVAGNLDSLSVPSDVAGQVDSTSRNNLIGVASDIDGGITGISNGSQGNLIGPRGSPINALIGPLAGNGGLTPTVALLAGSPALDAGSNALAVDPTTGQALATDQRGTGYPRISGNAVDIGAYEYQVAPPPSPTANNDSYTVVDGQTLVIPAPGVLANDTDPSGLALHVASHSGASFGTLALNPDGSFSYTPDPGFGGGDIFTYVASDGLANSARHGEHPCYTRFVPRRGAGRFRRGRPERADGLPPEHGAVDHPQPDHRRDAQRQLRRHGPVRHPRAGRLRQGRPGRAGGLPARDGAVDHPQPDHRRDAQRQLRRHGPVRHPRAGRLR